MSGRATCACELAEPCGDACSCRNPVMSGGCDRCATYGSEEQRAAMAESVARRLEAAGELAADDPIEWEDEDAAPYDRRRVWCRWCHREMLAEGFLALEDQDRDFPHEGDCAWVLAGGRG